MKRRLPLAVAFVATFLLGVLAFPALASHVFSDVPDSNVHHDNIGWAAENGIVEGYADKDGNPTGEFGPGNKITRAQAATMFKRHDDIINDCPGEWVEWVIEALDEDGENPQEIDVYVCEAIPDPS